MAFNHVPTFLRSAIARDPFCHGGIITPEDVLRLEAKFPTLFDKPAPPSEMNNMNSSDDDNDHVENVDNKLVEVKKKIIPKRNPGQIKPVMRVTAKGISKPQGIQTVTTRASNGARKPSEFHKKCVEKVTSAPMGQGKKVATTSNTATKTATVTNPKGQVRYISSSSKLTRPAQSFSLEDLRATLREVMKEDANQRKKWQRSDNTPSPYTEDLVQKFLGWKMIQDQKQKVRLNRNVHTLGKLKGQSNSNSKLKTDTVVAYHEIPQINQRKIKLSAHAAMMAGRVHPEKAIPGRVRSAPGFIRGIPELPPVPNYQKRIMMQSMAAKRGDDGNKQTRQTKGIGGEIDERNFGGGDGESGRKHVRWEEEEYEEEDDVDEQYHQQDERMVKHGLGADRRSSEESIKSNANMASAAAHQKPKRSGMRGTQMRLRSQKTPTTEQETAETVFSHDDRYKVKSSYNELLAARSEKTRYEVKGYLRKQEAACNFYKMQLEREKAERKNLKTRHDAHFIDLSSSDPSDNFTQKIKQMGQQSKEETNKILEVMAKELVYMEVLHQINELKQEQEEAELDNEYKRERQKPQHLASPSSSSPRQQRDKLSQVSLPNFVPTTTDQGASESEEGSNRKESKSSSDVVLKTPELTPPSAASELLKRRLVDKKKLSPSVGHDNNKVDIISLHTPELSPSPARLMAAIKERRDLEKKLLASSSPPQQQQLDTDCSEMSDFVFSEPSRKAEKSKGGKMSSVQEEMSVKLETPKLSISHSEDNKLLNANQNKTPEKDESTSSSVPSTFLETPSESRKSKPADTNVHRSVHEEEKYSEDFTPEQENVSEQQVSGSLLAATPVKHDDHLKSDADANDNLLNTSGETVIDLLSDGEFLGASYRSPGELSWHQQHPHSRPRAAFSSNALVDLSLNGQLKASSIVKQLSFASSTMEESNGEEESISILSYGAQILPGNDESAGEYLH